MDMDLLFETSEIFTNRFAFLAVKLPVSTAVNVQLTH